MDVAGRRTDRDGELAYLAMNRPIKFRAWDREMKLMRTVDAIDWRLKRVRVAETDQVGTWLYFDDRKEIDLVQFTGIHDKNGKEIYEGDIIVFRLSSGDQRWMIQYVENSMSFVFTKGLETEARTIRFQNSRESRLASVKHFEIIANLYENPELLPLS
jgi:uncharacterized phage protein (TIGR01671 family)